MQSEGDSTLELSLASIAGLIAGILAALVYDTSGFIVGFLIVATLVLLLSRKLV